MVIALAAGAGGTFPVVDSRIAAQVPAAGLRYEMQELHLPGFTYTEAVALGDRGVAACYSFEPGFKAVLWYGAGGAAASGLPSVAGAQSWDAGAVNVHGDAVGGALSQAGPPFTSWAILWNASGEVTRLAEGGSAHDINDAGQVVYFTLAERGVLWDDGVRQPLGFLLTPVRCLVSDDTDGDGDPDSDGDGLCDIWETLGMDVNGDSLIDLDLRSLGANPQRKDLFVEVDYMHDASHSDRPDVRGLQQVRDAFGIAPVVNPDGSEGISLHFVGATGLLDDALLHHEIIDFTLSIV